jgi:hypothetical protein
VLLDGATSCVCDDASDTSSDCARLVSGTNGTSLRLANVYYDLPVASSLADVPSTSLPVIHVTWGMLGVGDPFASSTGANGISSAADTGQGGSVSVSATQSAASGRPWYNPQFDITLPEAQVFLLAACDVVFASGLVAEAQTSSCIMTGFSEFNALGPLVNPGTTGSFPVAPTAFTRAMIYFLASLNKDDERRIWRQHVSFLFSTNPFSTQSSPSSSNGDAARHDTLQQAQPLQQADTIFVRQQQLQAAEFESASPQAKASWFTSLLGVLSAANGAASSSASTTGASAAALPSASLAPVHLNFFQLRYLMEHERLGRDFHLHFQGEELPLSAASSGAMGPQARDRGKRRDVVTPTLYVRICSLSMQFLGTFDVGSTSMSTQRRYADAWTNLVEEHLNEGVPLDGSVGRAFHASDTWVRMSAYLTFQQGVVAGFVVLFVMIFVTVMLSTGWNLRLALLVLVSVLALVVVLFGVIVNDGLDLGVIEYLSCQIVLALSVHSLLYLGHAYIVSPFQTRFGRSRHGLLEWGPSVLSAGVAMMLSAFVLIFATLQVLSRVGTILCTMTIVIMLFMVTAYVPLLQCVGPMGIDVAAQQAKEKAAAEQARLAAEQLEREAEEAAQPVNADVAASTFGGGLPSYPPLSASFPSGDGGSLAAAAMQRNNERSDGLLALATAQASRSLAAAVEWERQPSAGRGVGGGLPVLKGGAGFGRSTLLSSTAAAALTAGAGASTLIPAGVPSDPSASLSPSPSPSSSPVMMVEETPTDRVSASDLAHRIAARPARHARSQATSTLPNPHSRITGVIGSADVVASSSSGRVPTLMGGRKQPSHRLELSSEEDEGENDVLPPRKARVAEKTTRPAAMSPSVVSVSSSGVPMQSPADIDRSPPLPSPSFPSQLLRSPSDVASTSNGNGSSGGGGAVGRNQRRLTNNEGLELTELPKPVTGGRIGLTPLSGGRSFGAGSLNAPLPDLVGRKQQLPLASLSRSSGALPEGFVVGRGMLSGTESSPDRGEGDAGGDGGGSGGDDVVVSPSATRTASAAAAGHKRVASRPIPANDAAAAASYEEAPAVLPTGTASAGGWDDDEDDDDVGPGATTRPSAAPSMVAPKPLVQVSVPLPPSHARNLSTPSRARHRSKKSRGEGSGGEGPMSPASPSLTDGEHHPALTPSPPPSSAAKGPIAPVRPLRVPTSLPTRPAAAVSLSPPPAVAAAASSTTAAAPPVEAAHDWDDDDAPVPSRMSSSPARASSAALSPPLLSSPTLPLTLSKIPLGASALPKTLPPMASLGRPGSLAPVGGGAAAGLTPLRPIGAAPLLPSKPLLPSTLPSARAPLMMAGPNRPALGPASSVLAGPSGAAAGAAPPRRVGTSALLRNATSDDDDMELDIDEEDAANGLAHNGVMPAAAAPAAVTKKGTAAAAAAPGAVDSSVEVDYEGWDD